MAKYQVVTVNGEQTYMECKTGLTPVSKRPIKLLAETGRVWVCCKNGEVTMESKKVEFVKRFDNVRLAHIKS